MVSINKDELQQILQRAEFPRSNRYDAVWIIENQMGLNALWLTEWLCQKMDLKPGMRVLDMGCGRGLSSIFLAREFDVQVWATDLWISANDNRKRIEEAGLSDKVFPIHSDARELPYAEEFFDAIVCVDSYIYYGTDDLYLRYFHKFVKPRGQIGIIVPGFMQDINGRLPQHLIPFFGQDCWTWHTAEWWKWHWSRTGLSRPALVDVKLADTMPDGCAVWLQWKKARLFVEGNTPSLETDIEVLEKDGGRYMGWVRMIAERK